MLVPIEKVSSGRWHSQHVHPEKDVEVVGHLEPEKEFHYRGKDMYNRAINNGIDVLGGSDYHDVALAMHMERSLIGDDGIRNGGEETPSHDRVGSTMYVETHESLQGTLETLERPKLKLLPRSKLLENLELPVDYKQGDQQPSDPIHVRGDNELHRTANPVETGFSGSMVNNRAVERPKLNLKPRSQPLEQSEGNTGIKRNTVFAGARPREVVLKERGIDGVAVNHYDSQSPSRIKQDVPKIDPVSLQVTTAGYSGKAKNVLGDERVAKSSDGRDQRIDIERTDAQRRNKGNENRRNYREVEKHNNDLQLPRQERPPSPDTWRKPVENLKPDSPPAQGQRYGKVASALELAQAFSRPVSDPTVADHLSSPHGIPSRSQIPFSRLTGPGPRPQINGY
ncbi:eukaryotic translation initiation factor-related [Forsythia ovata]|uniref:Eukaryotic translation initiation factor-related n=1 Tax=Forsythia ovata TaxID=205694 RepID=A0ABD1R6E4_9LAMI